MNYIKEDKSKIKHLSTYGLALFFFLTPFEYPLADLASVSPLRIVGLLAMGLAAIDILIKRTIKINYQMIFVFLWLLYGFLTIAWVTNASRFQSYYSIYANNAIMFLVFSMISFTKHEVNFFKKAIVVGAGALLLYMLFVPNAVIYSPYQHRLTLNAGTEGLDQNYLAALMLLSFGLIFYNLCNTKQKKIVKIISIAFCALVLYYVLFTGSRSGLIAIVFIVLFSINTSWKTRLMIGVPVLLLIFIVFPLIVKYLPEELLGRFSLSALTGQEAESGTRLIIWKKALASLKDFKWVFGYGVGASQTIIGDAIGHGLDVAIHNHYLAMLAEVGLVGSVLINYPIFKMSLKMRKHDKSIAVSFVGILLMAFFLDVVTTKFFWAAMIMMTVCCSVKKTSEL